MAYRSSEAAQLRMIQRKGWGSLSTKPFFFLGAAVVSELSESTENCECFENSELFGNIEYSEFFGNTRSPEPSEPSA